MATTAAATNDDATTTTTTTTTTTFATSFVIIFVFVERSDEMAQHAEMNDTTSLRRAINEFSFFLNNNKMKENKENNILSKEFP